MQPRTHVTIALALLFCPACAPEDDLEFRTTYVTSASDGPVWNTHEMDDARFSEIVEAEHGGIGVVAVQEITLAGGVIATEFAVQNGELSVIASGGKAFTGDELLGSEWTLGSWPVELSTPMIVADRVVLEGTPYYTFAHDDGAGIVNNCPPPPPGTDPVLMPSYEEGRARLLTDFTLDETTGDITAKPGNTYIACTTGATGKAALWGYYDKAVMYKDLGILETAIRVIRADYCYDGVAHTTAGADLWLEDVWGGVQMFQVADPAQREIEAVWGPNGRLCRGKYTRLGVEMPQCSDAIELPTCEANPSFADYPDAWFITYVP